MATEKPARPSTPATGVCVVVTTFEHAHFLGAAVRSVMAQTQPVDEVIVVDDGSTDDPDAVLAAWPTVRLLRQENRGLAAARNTGLRAARSEYVLFLDADDVLAPQAVAAGLTCFALNPAAGLVYGAHRRVDADGALLGGPRYQAVGNDPVATLLRGNAVAMHGAALYRREALLELGGFDEGLRRVEDYDAYLRLARRHPVASHPDVVAHYRWHGTNMSQHHRVMLRTVLEVHRRHRPSHRREPERYRAWQVGRHSWRSYYLQAVLDGSWTAGRSRRATLLTAMRVAPVLTARRAARAAARRGVAAVPGPVGRSLARRLGLRRAPRLGRVRFGDLRSTDPVSLDFGWDRGTPIDRYYVETFLERCAADVRGRVMEVGDASYSRRFGGDRVTRQDVLHVRPGNPAATIVGDLGTAGVLPPSAFDCIVLTQTLHLVYDLAAAVRQMHASLRPGGVLLLTVPGISQLDRGQWGAEWYWALAPAGVRRLLGEAFGPAAVAVESHGNVLAATAFLQGLALSEVDTRELDVRDEAYPVVVTARAVKVPPLR